MIGATGMKVLMINASCGVGSTGRIVADLYAMLRSKDHICKVVYGHGIPKSVPVEDTFRVISKWGYYKHNLLGKLTDRAGFFSKRETMKLVDYIKQYNPDIVHLHNLHGFWINIELLFKCLREIDKPVVWTLHDCWPYTGHCSHYSVNKCYKWIDGCHDCEHLNVYPISYFFDNSRSNYLRKKSIFTSIKKMALVTPSKWLANETEKSFLKIYPVIPIPNGIDLKVFARKTDASRMKFGIPDGKIVLLAVSFVWNKEKGFDDLLELDRRLDGEKYVLVMVGLDKKQISSIPNTIIGIERLSDINELVELYSAADIFLNPSYQETMGMVTAEAIACGTPAIVYDQTAVPEIVEPSSGCVVKAGDVDAMINKIDYVLTLPKKNISRSALRYEKNKQYEKYYELYQNIVKQ